MPSAMSRPAVGLRIDHKIGPFARHLQRSVARRKGSVPAGSRSVDNQLFYGLDPDIGHRPAGTRSIIISAERSEVASMVHWLRLVISVFALVGLLATGTSGAVAAKTQHHCANMMMHQPLDGSDDSTSASKCCTTGVCFAVQPTLSTCVAVSSVRTFTRVFLPPLSDSTIPTLPVSPDLRPPIA